MFCASTLGSSTAEPTAHRRGPLMALRSEAAPSEDQQAIAHQPRSRHILSLAPSSQLPLYAAPSMDPFHVGDSFAADGNVPAAC